MSRNLMDQDFGSEEEDDDFNPVPAEESGNEEEVKVCLAGLLVVAGEDLRNCADMTRRGDE